ncbi:hypothetical protein FHR87_003748 [Azomonas macrocytogenes]|uniref:Uncharacterized protein n=1 Tax=Azomonas macrocytogenes TaxID=69962 RepID=A0A839T780_AZOMA|nr:hypothetical protein [Azomonas macrocytogenes]
MTKVALLQDYLGFGVKRVVVSVSGKGWEALNVMK